MAINSNVIINQATTEYGKFVEIINDSMFPPITSANGTYGLGYNETAYPKYAVLTYDVGTAGTNGSPFGDNASVDAFGKLRVSNPQTLFDGKFITGKAAYNFDEVLSGSATSTFIKGDSLIEMSTTAVNDLVIRQTYTHFNYQPGKSIQAFFTGLFHPQTNIIKRIGLFQSTSAIPYHPSDGIYLQSANNTVSFHVYKSAGTVSHLSAAQSDWNVDKLDGSGASGISIDFNKAQIITMDYEWLGLGRVRCGFVVGGKIYYAHNFNNINSFTQPYISSPNHPIRYEIRQIGAGSGLLKQICSTVMIEGGEEDVGTTITAELSGGISVDTTIRPLLALRLNPASVDLVAVIKNLNFYNTGNTAVQYKLIQEPTIIGGNLNSFQRVDGYDDVQFAIGSATLSLSGGYELTGGYIPSGNSSVAVGASTQEISGELARLGSKINGQPIIFVIAGRALTGTATSVYVTANMELRS